MPVRNFTLDALAEGTADLTFTLAAVPGTDAGISMGITGLSVEPAPPAAALRIPITTLAKLDAMRYDSNGDGVVNADATAAQQTIYATAFPDVDTTANTYDGYDLENDLDFAGTTYVTGTGWTPIEGFHGVFDGGGHIIDNLFINDSYSYRGRVVWADWRLGQWFWGMFYLPR